METLPVLDTSKEWVVLALVVALWEDLILTYISVLHLLHQ
jgi:hypothetical protein